MKIFKAVIFIFLFIGLFTLGANAAARLSGKILAVKNGIYTVELGDGSQVDIKLQSGAKSMRGQGIGAFRAGETVVFNIVSALNDSPLLADSVMDVAYANQNSTASYKMLRNTKVGGMATVAGPVPLAGQKADPLGKIGTGGTGFNNLSPAPKVNVPFTAAPAPMGSPVIGQVLTGAADNAMPQSHMFNQQNQNLMNQNNMNSPFNPMSPESPSGMFQQPNGMGMPQGNDPMMNLTMGTADPSSLILGGKKNTAEGMIYGNGVQGQNSMDPSRMFNGNNDDDEDESDGLEALNPANMNGMAGQQVNASGKIMNVDMSKGVIFYMSANAPGMQELGSVVLSPSTLVIDGRTGQAMSAQDIRPGMNMQATGIQQNGMIRATKITVIP